MSRRPDSRRVRGAPGPTESGYSAKEEENDASGEKNDDDEGDEDSGEDDGSEVVGADGVGRDSLRPDCSKDPHKKRCRPTVSSCSVPALIPSRVGVQVHGMPPGRTSDTPMPHMAIKSSRSHS